MSGSTGRLPRGMNSCKTFMVVSLCMPIWIYLVTDLGLELFGCRKLAWRMSRFDSHHRGSVRKWEVVRAPAALQKCNGFVLGQAEWTHSDPFLFELIIVHWQVFQARSTSMLWMAKVPSSAMDDNQQLCERINPDPTNRWTPK